MSVCQPATFIFGVGTPLPPLPEGWKFVEHPEEFLMATSPDGKLHFAEHVGDSVRMTETMPNPDYTGKDGQCRYRYNNPTSRILCDWPKEIK